MGLLDNLKDKAEELGEKAKDGLGAARGRASGLVDDVLDRMDGDDGPAAGSEGETRWSAESAYEKILAAAELKAAGRLAGPGQ